jgi:hypothetical protein
MSSSLASQHDSRHTYFYVFADKDTQTNEETTEVPPDRAVRQAFERLSRECGDRATVILYAPNALRRVLGIESLPAFAISDRELPLDGSLLDKPPNLPSVWNPLKFKERKRILESGTYVPRVEREIIELYPTPDKLYQFARDLHLKNIDHGIIEVSRKIETEVRKKAGRKVAKAIALTKQIYKSG